MRYFKSFAALLTLGAFIFAGAIGAADNPAPAAKTQKTTCCAMDSTKAGACANRDSCANQVCFVNATGDGPCLNCMGGPGSAKPDSTCACKKKAAGTGACACKGDSCKKMTGEKPAAK